MAKKDNNPVKQAVEQFCDNLRSFDFEAVSNEQPKGAFDICEDMTAEQMAAVFFDRNALTEPPYKVWQLNSKSYRYYYRYSPDGELEFYPSVTTILSQVLPKSEFLVKWVADMGYDEANRYKELRAAYGTFMHAQFEELIINRIYDLDAVRAKLRDYLAYHSLPSDLISWEDDIKKDVLAFAQFIRDYDVKPLAVEIALVCPSYGFAGMIDLVCEMNAPKGTERIKAIVDFKSGRKGFHEEHELQLQMYRLMWRDNFDEDIDRVFNFAPKEWRKAPTYHLKDQTEAKSARKLSALLDLAAVLDDKEDRTFTTVGGIINLDKQTNENVLSLSLAEVVNKRMRERGEINNIKGNNDERKN